MSEQPLFSEILPPGAPWSMRIRKNRSVRLTTLDAAGNLSALFYRADQPLDRLNIPDTLKALHTSKLTRGHVLMSDMGHALLSITDDTLGWHDPLGGHIDAARTESKYGKHNYQDFRNDFHRNARDNFLVELSKHGLGMTDIVANINFFGKVTADEEGKLIYLPEHCPAGCSMDLRTDVDVLFVLSNTPHPMAPGGSYPQTRILLEIREATPAALDDFCRNFRPECGRALALSERLYL